MATMGPEITLPALEVRPWGLFTQVVDEHPPVIVDGAERSALGVKWINRDAYQYGAVGTADPCDVDANDDLLANSLTLSADDTAPFQSFNSLACSVIGGLEMAEINEMLQSDAEITRSAALVLGLTTAISADHANLAADATDLGASASIIAAIGLIDDGLGDRIANGRGYVFIPLKLLAAAKAAGAIIMMDGTLMTAAGHRVISDAGHRPESVIYGTGALTYRMGEARRVDNPDGFTPATNMLRGTYVRYAWVAFNKNHAVKTTVS